MKVARYNKTNKDFKRLISFERGNHFLGWILVFAR